MVRVTLQHVLPLALLLTSVIAQRESSENSVSRTADDSTATATDEGSTTATATGKETSTKSSESSTKATSTQASTTGKRQPTTTWDPEVPKTVAPDLLGGTTSVQSSGYLLMTVVVGLVTMGMVLA